MKRDSAFIKFQKMPAKLSQRGLPSKQLLTFGQEKGPSALSSCLPAVLFPPHPQHRSDQRTKPHHTKGGELKANHKTVSTMSSEKNSCEARGILSAKMESLVPNLPKVTKARGYREGVLMHSDLTLRECLLSLAAVFS